MISPSSFAQHTVRHRQDEATSLSFFGAKLPTAVKLRKTKTEKFPGESYVSLKLCTTTITMQARAGKEMIDLIRSTGMSFGYGLVICHKD